MKTHENSDDGDERNKVDFCWEDSYVQMTNQYSVTHPNGSPRQAFRAGFREGVKMSLSQGGKVDPDNFKGSIWWGNYKRLITWCSVGADVENGLWAMYGTRLGCYKTNLTDWDYINVRDFEYLNNLWETKVAPDFEADTLSNDYEKCYKTGYKWDKSRLLTAIDVVGTNLRKSLGIEVAELDEIQSKFYKAAQANVPRMNKLFTETELNDLRRLNR
jgi:hypothetical protein